MGLDPRYSTPVYIASHLKVQVFTKAVYISFAMLILSGQSNLWPLDFKNICSVQHSSGSEIIQA
jgi:hypothetical protein